MSGGSYDYIYLKIEGIELSNTATCKYRASFQKLLKLVANAMHDIEWVDSGDYGKGDEIDAIKKCFNFFESDADTIAKARAFDEMREMFKRFLS